MFFFFRYRRLWQETVTIKPRIAAARAITAIDHVIGVHAQELGFIVQGVSVKTLIEFAIRQMVRASGMP